MAISSLNGAPPATTALTPALVNDLFNDIDTSVESLGQANAEGALATGDTAEASDYASAGAIAAANARLATASGQVEQAQTGLEIRQTIGAQQAGIAGAGFANTGTALNLLRSSTRQGTLQQQIIGMNSQLEAGGYQAQAAAAAAEGSAASAAGTSATDLAATETAVGNASKTNAINLQSTLGVNIPGIGGLSATSVPSIPGSLAAGNPQGGAQGGLPTYII